MAMRQGKSLQLEGTVWKVPGTQGRVELENGHQKSAHVAGRMPGKLYPLVPATREGELTHYDLTRVDN